MPSSDSVTEKAAHTPTVIIRTQNEIVARYREAERRDVLGFERDEYLACLDYEHLEPFLKSDITAGERGKLRDEWTTTTLNEIDQRAKNYLSFWLEKIEGERGLSVGRATQHYIAWKWLLGHDDADTFPGSTNGGDGGWYQRRAYDYINAQINSGEWDRKTNAAIAKAEGRS
jgi:hypothetical protein